VAKPGGLSADRQISFQPDSFVDFFVKSVTQNCTPSHAIRAMHKFVGCVPLRDETSIRIVMHPEYCFIFIFLLYKEDGVS